MSTENQIYDHDTNCRYRSAKDIFIDDKSLIDILDECRKHGRNNAVSLDLELAIHNYDRIKTHLSDLDLSNVYLVGIDFSFMHLSNINFSGAKLDNTVFHNTDLVNCKFNGAYIRTASFSVSNIFECQFDNTNLYGSIFSRAFIDGTIFDKSGFSTTTSFINCNIIQSKFTNIKDIGNYTFTSCTLKNNDISKNHYPLHCPSHGGFIGWKMIHPYLSGPLSSEFSNNILAKLYIPADAKRSSSTTQKCRCSKAKVLELYEVRLMPDNSNKVKIQKWNNDSIENTFISPSWEKPIISMTYTKGEYVYPDSFDDDRWNECSHGIHFFLDIIDAINYVSHFCVYEYEFV